MLHNLLSLRFSGRDFFHQLKKCPFLPIQFLPLLFLYCFLICIAQPSAHGAEASQLTETKKIINQEIRHLMERFQQISHDSEKTRILPENEKSPSEILPEPVSKNTYTKKIHTDARKIQQIHSFSQKLETSFSVSLTAVEKKRITSRLMRDPQPDARFLEKMLIEKTTENPLEEKIEKAYQSFPSAPVLSETDDGHISGTVTGPDGTTPLQNIDVRAYQWDAASSGWDYIGWTDTDAAGNYDISGLPSGTYRVQFWDANGAYLPEWYDNQPDLDSATDITVNAPDTTAGINASLEQGGHISGTVTAPDGTTPLQDIYVYAYQWDAASSRWDVIKGTDTDTDGNYDIGGLPSGTYRVQFWDGNGAYLPECYDNQPDLDSATDITVNAPDTTSGINASLEQGGHISGTVTGPDGTTPLQNIDVYVYQWDAASSWWDYISDADTDTAGNYDIGGLPSGTYRVQFWDGNGAYLPECYDNQPDLDSATDITVNAPTNTAGINASLEQGGHISGTVTAPDGTTPLQNIDVYVYQWDAANSWWDCYDSASTDASGNYDIGGLPSGTYRVQFWDWNGTYLTECYDNQPDLDSATDITVNAPTNTAGINASLEQAGHISGTVTGPDGTTPLQNIEVSAYQWDAASSWWDEINDAYTDAAGNYDIGGLPSGTYRIEFRDRNGTYLTEWYDNQPDLDSATDITVNAPTTTAGINASLEQAGHISGTVTGPDGTTPLQNIEVSAYQWNAANSWWDQISGANTDAAGNYDISGLPSGTYRVEFRDWNGTYVTEWYDNQPDLDSATDITVNAPTTTSGINASLEQAGHISGTVTGPDGTTPLQNINVRAYQWNAANSWWDEINDAYTDAAGNYDIGGLPSGTYWVEFRDWNGTYLTEWYDNQPDLDSATDITVNAPTTTSGINASLEQAGHISGTVTGPDGTTPLQNINVRAYQWNAANSWWDEINDAYTDAAGNYDISGLPSGTYWVEFRDWNGTYLTEWYDNQPDLDSATDITVNAPTTTAGINASLEQAGHISGTVTGPDGTTPLQNIEVSAYQWDAASSWWDEINDAYTDAAGNYDIGGLPSGTYRIEFQDWNGTYATEWYDNQPDLDSATDITVNAPTTTAGINASLALAGHISGTVTGPDGTTPIQNIHVRAYQWDAAGSGWDQISRANTDAVGNYDIGGLPSGTYRVEFQDWNGTYVTEWYDNQPNFGIATDITVSAPTTTSGINASLEQAGHISGTVTGHDNTTPLQNIEVNAYQWDSANSWWDQISWAYTDAAGNYDLGGLPSGTYRVEFQDWNGTYATEWYDNQPDLDSATDIAVNAPTTTSGINASLALGGHISGTVTGPNGITPLQNIDVNVYQWNAANSWWDSTGWATTDASGNYDIGGLPSGTYRLQFRDWQNGTYVTECYDNQPDLDSATDVAVTAPGTTAGIDVSLALGGHISGTVTGPDSTTPLQNIDVNAYQWNAAGSYWDYINDADTDAYGNYDISGLPSGTYRVQFRDRNNTYVTEWYDNQPDRDSATDISVGTGETVTDKDASLSPQSVMDTDNDGLPDAIEDANHNGIVDPGETDPNDADTDDDGVVDGAEDDNQNGIVDNGETDPRRIDTDGDGIQDGTEMGLTLDSIGSDTDTQVFIPDADDTTTTDPLDSDSDKDGLSDGEEDKNKNGRLDPGETDPNHSDRKKAMPWLMLLLSD